MNTHINRKAELAKILQALPQEQRHIVIDAVGRPVGGYAYIETLTDYVYRIQDQLVRA